MEDNTTQIVSVTEADRNFSRVAREANRLGSVVITRNGKPKYKLIDLDHTNVIEMTDDEIIDFVSARILKKHHKAFEELAKR